MVSVRLQIVLYSRGAITLEELREAIRPASTGELGPEERSLAWEVEHLLAESAALGWSEAKLRALIVPHVLYYAGNPHGGHRRFVRAAKEFGWALLCQLRLPQVRDRMRRW